MSVQARPNLFFHSGGQNQEIPGHMLRRGGGQKIASRFSYTNTKSAQKGAYDSAPTQWVWTNLPLPP